MEDLKPIIARNLTALRQAAKMTQSELAEKLNYSDKAISKWERAESLPDITVLKTIADLFGVPLDYLVRENGQPEPEPERTEEPEAAPSKKRNRAVITVLSVLLVWFIATTAFVIVDMIVAHKTFFHFISFVYAVPVSMIVWLVFNAMWFSGRKNYPIISLLMWSLLLSVTLTLYACGIFAWQLMLLGIPGQIIILMSSKLQYKKRDGKKEKKKKEKKKD
ncbi:MAG: helix-turn-helix transcriptional regulator [Oscillospiraceae bacterium]|nr:helix-turn-helix transcriptional regulator [Oscillospiraceae bacterium]